MAKLKPKIFNVRTSSSKLANLKRLSKRQSAGTLDKKQATALIIKALNPRTKPITIGLNEVYKIGFETVLDNGIDKPKCEFCGKVTCLLSAFDIPFETLDRLQDAFNFDCKKIKNCILANRKEYLENPKVKENILILKHEIKNVVRKIEKNENLLNGFYISAKRQKLKGIDFDFSFETRKKNNLRNCKRFSFPIPKRLRKLEIKANKKAMFQSLALYFAFPLRFKLAETIDIFYKIYFPKVKFNFQFQSFRNRFLAFKENKKAVKNRKRVSSKIVLTKIKIDLTQEIEARCKFNLSALKVELENLQKELKQVSSYKIPKILTITQEKQLIENCKKLKGKKAKFAYYQKLKTENFLANF